MTAHTDLYGMQPTSLESVEETWAKNSANTLDVQHAAPNANIMSMSTKTVTGEKKKRKQSLQHRSRTGMSESRSQSCWGKSGLPPEWCDYDNKQVRLVNKQVKACHDCKVTCLSERSGFSLTISHLHFGAEEPMKMLPPHHHHLSGTKIEWGQF